MPAIPDILGNHNRFAPLHESKTYLTSILVAVKTSCGRNPMKCTSAVVHLRAPSAKREDAQLSQSGQLPDLGGQRLGELVAVKVPARSMGL